MIFRVVEDIDQSVLKKWEEYVLHHPNGGFMHSTALYRFLNTCPGLKPVPIVVLDEHEQVVGIGLGETSVDRVYRIPVKRTTFYAEPLANPNPEIWKIIIGHIRKKAAGLFTEIRATQPLSAELEDVLKLAGFSAKNHLSAKIRLSDKEQLWKQLRPDKRKNIKKAQSSGMIIKEVSSGQGIGPFYLLLKDLYRQKHHPLRRQEYFDHLVALPEMHLMLACYENDVVAGQLYAVYKNRMTLLYAAFSRQYKHFHAMDLLTWVLMEKACDLSLDVFDFGGAGDPNRPYGVRKFKERFSPEIKNAKRYLFSNNILFIVIHHLYLITVNRLKSNSHSFLL